MLNEYSFLIEWMRNNYLREQGIDYGVALTKHDNIVVATGINTELFPKT
jgi:hypothetical protein